MLLMVSVLQSLLIYISKYLSLIGILFREVMFQKLNFWPEDKERKISDKRSSSWQNARHQCSIPNFSWKKEMVDPIRYRHNYGTNFWVGLFFLKWVGLPHSIFNQDPNENFISVLHNLKSAMFLNTGWFVWIIHNSHNLNRRRLFKSPHSQPGLPSNTFSSSQKIPTVSIPQKRKSSPLPYKICIES